MEKEYVLINWRGNIIPLKPEEVEGFFDAENLAEYDN